ncbi:hypothetical protein HDU89_008929, partial [Geranomyces variabilis]
MSENKNAPPAEAPAQEVDPVAAAVAEKTKIKRPRTEKQIAAMKAAQEKRTANLKAMKELKEKSDEQEAKERKAKEKEAKKLEAQKVIEAYEKEKQHIKEEKAAARLAKKATSAPVKQVKTKPAPVEYSSSEEEESDED